jgi:hypothetical protein
MYTCFLPFCLLLIPILEIFNMSHGLAITLVFFFFTVAITLVVIRELCMGEFLSNAA